MTLSLSDQDIIDKLREGETHVFKYCYPMAFPKVKGMVLKNNGNLADAEDIFQETLVIFYKNSLKPDFILSASLSTYLYAISWRLWMKQIRDSRKHVEIMETDMKIVEAFDFELADAKSDTLTEVMKAMESAGKRCREILVSFYFNQLKMEQIAVNLEFKDERAVREQKYRCMKRIKEMMKGAEVGG